MLYLKFFALQLQALEQLLAAVDEGRSITLTRAFYLMFQHRHKQLQLAADGLPSDTYGPDIPRNCMLVRKVQQPPRSVSQEL